MSLQTDCFNHLIQNELNNLPFKEDKIVQSLIFIYEIRFFHSVIFIEIDANRPMSLKTCIRSMFFFLNEHLYRKNSPFSIWYEKISHKNRI